ncbi:MAG: SBBP repeat-containing protein, partial [Phycisphaerales bacterium]|nr:SBBP repeat-containing protein [Phycisphaerales bacterium]
GDDAAYSIAVDAAGAAYVVGAVGTTYVCTVPDPVNCNFPTTNGAIRQTALSTYGWDAFATKLDPSGASPMYSTYLGGSGGDDFAYSVAVDSSGAAVIAGSALRYAQGSTLFQLTNAIQSSFGGGFADAFVMKIDALGSAFVYSTFLGGADDDQAAAVAVDSTGAAYAAGYTTSTNFNHTAGALQQSLAGASDAFVTKLSSTGGIAYSTYLGGASDDSARSVAVDGFGAASIVGLTSSSNFPTASQVLGTNGGAGVGFATRLNPAGSALDYSVFLPFGFPASVAVDASGASYIAGMVDGGTLTQVNPMPGASGPAFLAKLSENGSAFLYKTYAGAFYPGWANSLAVDASGSI